MKLNRYAALNELEDELDTLVTQLEKFPDAKDIVYPRLRNKMNEIRFGGAPEPYVLQVLRRNWKNLQER